MNTAPYSEGIAGSVVFDTPNDARSFAEWDAFALAQPYHNFFQSGSFAQMFFDHPRYGTKLLVARHSSSGKILGGLVGLCITEKSGVFAQLTTRVVINGGPLIAAGAEAVLPFLLEQAKSLFADRPVCYTEIWCMQPQDALLGFYPPGYSHSGHLNFFIETESAWDKIFLRFSSALRKTIRNNSQILVIDEVQSSEELAEFYKCLQDTYRRVRVPLIPFDVFERVFESKLGLFILGRANGEIVAVRVALPFGDELYDWYAGGYETQRHINGNALLVNYMLQQASMRGIKRFNFGGAGKPDKPYGPRDFKRRFGGELVNHGRWLFINSHLRYTLLRLAISIFNRLNGNA